MNHLPIEKHLALYTTFHQDGRNQLVHQLASPFVYFSALVAVQALVPALVLPLLVGSILMLSLADLKGGLAAGAAYVVEALAAVWLSRHFSTLPLLLIAAVVQGAAWASLIFIGHMTFEPSVDIEGQPASKGLYFERHYNRGEGFGVRLNRFDRVLQFSIAPLAHANEVLFALGLRHDLEQRVAEERAKVIARLSAGQTPFAEEAAVATWTEATRAAASPLLSNRASHPLHPFRSRHDGRAAGPGA